MKKKLLIASFLVGFPCYCLGWPQGFYVGAGAGADTQDFKQTSHVIRPGSFDVIEKDPYSAQGISGNAFGGYAWYRNWFYLAGEVNGNLSSSSFTTSNTESINASRSASTYRINYSWGLSALPGIIIPGNALLYGRIGYTSGHFNLKTSDASLYNANQMLEGLRFGVGLEKNIYKQVGIRFDYSHINYQSVSKKTYDVIGNVTKRTNIKPDTNAFEFSLVYRLA